jgi:hypothetical protein
MPHLIAADVAAISRISAVPSILEVGAEATGMRYAVIARVTQETWVACAVLDRIEFGLGVGGELDESARRYCAWGSPRRSPQLLWPWLVHGPPSGVYVHEHERDPGPTHGTDDDGI